MDLDVLRYEVQRIDGSSASVFQAMDLLFEEILSPDFQYLPKSIEYGFLEEFYKCLINWMGKGETQTLKDVMQQLNERMKKDDAFLYPFAGSNSKKRFGGYLSFIYEMIEIYLRSDLELKDALVILGPKENHRRYRALLSALYDWDIKRFTISAVMQFTIYTGKTGKTAERDIAELVKYDFLSRDEVTSKTIYYQLTSRAWYYRQKIEERIAEDRKPVPGEEWDDVVTLAPDGTGAYVHLAAPEADLLRKLQFPATAKGVAAKAVITKPNYTTRALGRYLKTDITEQISAESSFLASKNQ